ncbi:T3/T7 RNA polymerase [Variovorax sp. RKNM96]|uniref:DNA-directed RNA polymerase n=1 Tax=Variovorax sp. RKNM96 TaxID=2681552 RepID=UPI00197F5D34|nr:DNA-directed RNA polymerase [Variovorax sp. RKNM96]QSI31445.1 T3/T7 RNA polymerase [Variovorax sp. RKNM96]
MNMQTTYIDPVEAQRKLEDESVEMGIAAYRRTLNEDGPGNLLPGQQLVRAAMQPLVAAIKAWLVTTREGLASRSAGVFYFLDDLDAEAAAWITASSCISRLHESPTVTSVAGTIASRLEQTINIEAICAMNPRLATQVTKRVGKMSSDRNRLVFIRNGGERVDAKLVQWDDSTRLRLGSLLIELFHQSAGLVVPELVVRGKTDRNVILRPSESCRRWLEESHARCELMSPVRMPMVCFPRQWTNPFNGGYLSKELRQPLVKTYNRNYLTQLKDWDMDGVYATVNRMQDTAWAINEPVYGVMKELWESGHTIMVGADKDEPLLPPREEQHLPAKSWIEGETPEPAILSAWKMDAAKTYEKNAKTASKRIQLTQKLWVAEKMVECGNRFHFVYNLDWRGRLYPVAGSLSPQGDDSAKALMHFSKAVKLGDNGAYWLAVHGANSFGVDKVSFEDRIEWVELHTEDILATSKAPTSESIWWTEADAPFTFLAFCFEWSRLQTWVDAGNEQADFESTLPVAFDGACNGLQNFSAMLRDPIGGKATGLVPGEKPADIYSAVANLTQVHIDADAAAGDVVAQRWVGKMTRDLAKRNTMTVPYGVTVRGMRDQLFAKLTGSEAKHRGEDANYLSICNHESISQVVVAAKLAMDWLKEAAKVAASNQLPVRWTTPMGFLAVQDYREAIGERLDFEVVGKRYRLTIERTGDKLNTRKQSLGISPNFVHSLDASHLMRTVLFCVEDGMTDFAMIHDSYGCHAGHADLLRDNLRGAFIEQYSLPVLENFRNELLEQLPEELQSKLPPLPPMGDLDLEQVRTSEYFFA